MTRMQVSTTTDDDFRSKRGDSKGLIKAPMPFQFSLESAGEEGTIAKHIKKPHTTKKNRHLLAQCSSSKPGATPAVQSESELTGNEGIAQPHPRRSGRARHATV